MASLAERLMKNSVVKGTTFVGQAKHYKNTQTAPTAVPMINVGLSGNMDEGLTPGITMLAAPSKHFKTMFALIMAKGFLDKYPDGMILFYNNEFGTPDQYFRSLDIDTKRVVEVNFTDIEILKQDVVAQLDELDTTDKVMMIIDSIGMVASRKELVDVREEKVVGDMTRAKSMKGFWRMITPLLKMKQIPLVAVNHTYMTQEMYSKAVVSGGTGGIYSADTIWIIGKQQEKTTKDGVVGSNFIINIEKSRFVKERAKIPIKVLAEGGLNKWTGMFDIALDQGYITSPSKGYFARVDKTTGEVSLPAKRRGEIEYSNDFWNTLLTETDFKEHVRNMFSLGMSKLLQTDDGVTIEDLENEDI